MIGQRLDINNFDYQLRMKKPEHVFIALVTSWMIALLV